MLYEKVINTPNWSILQKIAFPLKIKIKERLDSDIYSIATHIQRYNETSPKGRPIPEEILNVTKYTKITANIERGFHFLSFCFILCNPCWSKNQLNRVNQLQAIVQLIKTGPVVNFPSLAQQIKTDTEGIRKTISYRNCLSEIYEQSMQSFWQKMQMLGLIAENHQ